LLTVKLAAADVAVCVPLHVFVKIARYWFVLRETPGFVIVNVPVVTPLYGATFKRFVNAPPPILTCHWTVGTGVPLAVAVKDALAIP
jgi:hypothetical protein